MAVDVEQLYQAARDYHLQPLWIDTASYVPRHPNPKVVAAHWSGPRVLELLREAGEKVSSELADRRVLVCNNPGLPPFSPTTQTMYACVQLLQPGEHASMHRHSQSAFRFVLSGAGSHTILNGQPFPMQRGDFIVTPAWTWHGHRNDSSNEVIWLDGLDSGILRLFDATFFELPSGDGDAQPSEPPGAVVARGDPDWHFDWDTMHAKLQAARALPIDACLGHRVRYLHPRTGLDPLPTVAAYLNLLPAGFSSETYRSSDSVVYVVHTGSGRTIHDGKIIEWAENDVFTIPTWEGFRHEVSADAVLFSFSDRGAQERLECWRDKRG